MTKFNNNHESRAAAVDIVLDAKDDAALLRVEKLLVRGFMVIAIPSL